MSARATQLICHPASLQPPRVDVTFAAARAARGLVLHYKVTGDLAEIVLSSGAGGIRKDELWRTTCFEVFVGAPNGAAYQEFNFAPNGDWAAYGFSGYRSDPVDLEMAPPRIALDLGETQLSLAIALDGIVPRQPVQIGPAIILESRNGARSYWALHHASDKPDFHLAETFQITLD